MTWQQDSNGTWFDNTTDPATADNTAPWYAAPLSALTGIYQQKQLIDINVERAKQGLPPISAANIAPTVNVGLPADQLQLLTMFGVGVLAYLFLKKGK
jgi:hypothetical protein